MHLVYLSLGELETKETKIEIVGQVNRMPQRERDDCRRCKKISVLANRSKSPGGTIEMEEERYI